MIIASVIFFICCTIIVDKIMYLGNKSLFEYLNVKSPILSFWRILYILGVLTKNKFNVNCLVQAFDNVKRK